MNVNVARVVVVAYPRDSLKAGLQLRKLLETDAKLPDGQITSDCPNSCQAPK
jgi:hypothetical protein